MATPSPTPTPQVDTADIKNTLNDIQNTINSGVLGSSQPLVKVPNPTPDTTNYAGILNSSSALMPSTGNAKDDAFLSYLKGYVAPASESDIYNKLYPNSGIDEATKNVNDLTTELNSINAEAKVAELNAEKGGGAGGGGTSTYLSGEQSVITREAAIRALPVQAQLAAAQGNQKLAQDKFNTAFKIATDDATATYNYNKAQRDAVLQYASDEEKTQLAKQQKEDDQNFQLLTNNLNQGQTLAGKAIDAGQPAIAAKILALDPKSKTYATDVATLAQTIKPALTATQKNSDGSGTPTLTTEEKAFQTQITTQTKALAKGGSWATAYNYLANLYGKSNPELTTPYTAAQKQQLLGQKMSDGYVVSDADQTPLDILLHKSQYYSQQ